MKIIKSYKYKLYNAEKNKRLINDIECYSEVYNHCVALYNRYYKIFGKNINKYDLQKHLTKIKNRDKIHWKKLGSQAIQEITDRLDKSYKLFFSNLKRGIKSSPPKFKSRHRYKSFTLKQAGYSLDQEESEIIINKKKYKYFNCRRFDGDIKTVTIKRNHKGELFIIFSVQQEFNTKKGFETGKMAGFDFGLGTFFVGSDEKKYDSPQYLNLSFENVSKRLLCPQKWKSPNGELYKSCIKAQTSTMFKEVDVDLKMKILFQNWKHVFMKTKF